MTFIFKLQRGNPVHLSGTTGKRIIHIFQGTERERWAEKLRSSTKISKISVTITDLNIFLMNEAEEPMKGSAHEDNLFIVHDALVLIKEKETINRMRKNGYLHRRLRPLNGLQDGTPYAVRP